MSKCCNCCNPYFLGCFSHCGDIKFPTTASISGLHLLYAIFNGTVFIVDAKNFAIGDDLIFSLQNLAENYYFESVYILDPNDSKVSITIDDTPYNCFSFKTQFINNVTDTN